MEAAAPVRGGSTMTSFFDHGWWGSALLRLRHPERGVRNDVRVVGVVVPRAEGVRRKKRVLGVKNRSKNHLKILT